MAVPRPIVPERLHPLAREILDDLRSRPEARVIVLGGGWRSNIIFDRFSLAYSPAYHAFRAHYGWEPVERLPCFSEPIYRRLDAAEEREDAYEDRV